MPSPRRGPRPPRRFWWPIAFSIWSWQHCSRMDDATRNELLFLRDLGYTHLDVAEGRVAAAAPAAESNDMSEPSDGLLAELERVAVACEKCRLAKTRTQVVYGVGNPNADLMF